jgi:hypothetical protein
MGLNMRKILIAGILLIGFVVSGKAQQWHFAFATGFNIGVPGTTYQHIHNYRYSPAWGYVVDDQKGYGNSLGQGIPFDLEVGRTWRSGIMAGLMFGYSHGLASEHEGMNEYTTGDETFRITTSGRYFHLSPYLGMYKRVKRWGLLARVAPMFAFVDVVGTSNQFTPPLNGQLNGDEYFWRREYSGPVSVGVKCGFEVEYNFLSGPAVFVGLMYTHLDYSPTSSEVTEYLHNKNDALADLAPIDRYSEYSNEKTLTYTINSDGTINWDDDPQKPYNGLRFDFPFDNLAVRIGVRYHLKSREEKKGAEVKK